MGFKADNATGLMKSDSIFSTVRKFLTQHNPEKKPFLLALSGGPDSTALYHALLHLRETENYLFAIAHVNHRWREESDVEAKILEQKAQHFKIPFYLKILNPLALNGNLENCCRIERFQFFKNLCIEHGYHAIMLGHHAGDQAETVLKRILETSNVLALKGLVQIGQYEELLLWRPFLKLSKKDLLIWLDSQKISFFEDKSNKDLRFLRGRFREEIIPYLSQTVGKQVTKNLCLISEEIIELNEFIDAQVQVVLKKISVNDGELTLDLKEQTSLFLIKAIIRALCQQQEVFISREQLQLAAISVLSKKGCRQITSGKKRLSVERGRMRIVAKEA